MVHHGTVILISEDKPQSWWSSEDRAMEVYFSCKAQVLF